MKILTYIKIGVGLVIVVLLIAGFFWLRGASKNNYIDFGTSEAIDLTPTQIQSMKAIGEWEFLSVSTEELVDTVRKGIFTDDELVRIYYGTLRLGVNMQKVGDDWIQTSGDSITLTLPKIELLDKEFIDEARTKSFYERGSWKPADRDALYQKAYRQMLSHSMTKENLQAAEANASQQMHDIMRALGYQHVSITFQKK
jgi:hypothetical protein